MLIKGASLKLKVIELFEGIGSQTQALKNIGIDHEVIAISDNDKYADKSYRILHDENVNNLGDIRTIEQLPLAHLWTYSFPCQDISVAGLQRGLDKGSSTRSGLLWEVERLLLKAKETNTLPKYLLLENVKNLIGKQHKDNYEKWLFFLKTLGYTTYTKVLNAKYFGVPQNRERVFGISILGDHQPYEFPTNQELKIRLKDILEEKVDEKYYLQESTIMSIINTTFKQRLGLLHDKDDICATLCARDFIEPKCIVSGELHDGKWAKVIKMSQKVYSPEGISPTIMTYQGGNTEPKIIAIRGREQGQVIEPNNKGISNALTTVQKDNLVIEKPNKLIARGYKKFIDKKGYIPELFNPYHSKELIDIAPTQTGNCGSDTSSASVLLAETICLNRYKEDGTERSVQDRIYDSNGVSVSVTPSFRGSISVKTATKKGFEEVDVGDSINLAFPNSETRRGRVGKNMAQTLDTQCNQGTLEIDEYIRIRKLTPTECFRLMGWKDEQINKIKAAKVSNTQMYKQAGNGIVVTVLEAIFKKLFQSG